MKTTTLLFFIFTITFASAQSNSIDFQSHPLLVMKEIFRAAKEKDYSNLDKLCPPDKSNDGDTQKYICNIASSSNETIKEFLSYFDGARVNGKVTYSNSNDGKEMAKVPFWFNHPGGESRSNETMNLIKIKEKWYLYSF